MVLNLRYFEKGLGRSTNPITKNHLEKVMDNNMETGSIGPMYGELSIGNKEAV